MMPVPPEAIDRVGQLAGEKGDMEIEFDYRGTTYSTSDLEPHNIEQDDGEENVPPQENDDNTPVEHDMNAEGEEYNEEDDMAVDNDANIEGDGEDAQDVDTPDDEIMIEEEVEESDPPPLEEHAREPGGPAARTRSASIAVGRRYFWRLEDGVRMRN